MSLQCPELKKNVEVNGNIEDIYKDNIKIDIIETMEKITEFRRQWFN